MEEESLVNPDDDDIPILAAVATYMRRDLHGNIGFYENILPVYTIDSGTFEALCREVQATGRVPQQHAFGRPPIPLDKQVLAFIWFKANSEVIRSIAEEVASIFLTKDMVVSGLEVVKTFVKLNKLTTAFYASVLLLIMNFVITLSK